MLLDFLFERCSISLKYKSLALPTYRLLLTVFIKQYIPAFFLNILLYEIIVSLLLKSWKTFIGIGAAELFANWDEKVEIRVE